MYARNDEHNCCVRVTCTLSDFSANDTSLITSVEVRRACAGTTTTIGNIAIASPSELNFTFIDPYTASGAVYQYTCVPIIGGSSGVGVSSSKILCAFDDVFIGDLQAQYICRADAKYESTLNLNTAIVQTYYSAYPHAVHNGDQQYHTGSFKGVFIEMDEQCNFVLSRADSYRQQVKAFLANPKPKTIKTKEGNVFLVEITGGIREEYSSFRGLTTLSFEWTEVGPPPTYGIVVI